MFSLLLLAVLLAALPVQAQPGEQRAGLVVRFGDGRVSTACVRFSEPEISGLALLERSGLPIVVQGSAIGAAVCKIGPEGCNFPAESCFCRREGGRSIYWAFYRLDGASWAYAVLGAANVPVRDGDVHGWAWGIGDSSGGALPPVLSLEAICGSGSAAVPPAVVEAAPTAEATVAPPTLEPTAAPPTITPPTLEPTDVPPTSAPPTLEPTAVLPTSASPTLAPTAVPAATAPPTSTIAPTEAVTVTVATMPTETAAPTSPAPTEVPSATSQALTPVEPLGSAAGGMVANNTNAPVAPTSGEAAPTPAIPWGYLGFATLVVLLAGWAFMQARRLPPDSE